MNLRGQRALLLLLASLQNTQGLKRFRKDVDPRYELWAAEEWTKDIRVLESFPSSLSASTKEIVKSLSFPEIELSMSTSNDDNTRPTLIPSSQGIPTNDDFDWAVDNTVELSFSLLTSMSIESLDDGWDWSDKKTDMPTTKLTESTLETNAPSPNPTLSPNRQEVLPSSSPTDVEYMPDLSMSMSMPNAADPSTFPTSSPTETLSSTPSSSAVPSATSSSSPSESISPTVTDSSSPSASGLPTLASSSTPSLAISLVPSSSTAPTDTLIFQPSSSSPTTKSPTKKPTKVFYPVNFPTYNPTVALEFMMTRFSTNASVYFEDMAEPMDDETTAIFEQVVTGQLIDASLENDHKEHQVFISSVKVLDQQLLQIGRRHDRSLATTLLQIIIKVVGEVEPEASASYINNVTVAIQNEFDGEDNQRELTQRLAKESTFFDSYYSQQNELVVAEAQGGVTDDSSEPPWTVLIIGGCVAVAVLVGSMFYMERRNNASKGRRVAEQDVFQRYDLNAMEDMMDLEMQGKTKRTPTPFEMPKSVQESRIKSVVDVDDEKSPPIAVPSPMTKLESEPEPINMSLDKLKERVKQRDSNIFIFTEKSSAMTPSNHPDDDLLQLKATVSELSNPSQVDDIVSPNPRSNYLPDGTFDYNHADKLVGDQMDARAILTPFTPRMMMRTPRAKTAYSFGSPISAMSRKDKLFDVQAPPGPLGIIIDTTSDGPMIHSLKPTSQLLGLVNPGDLIVGLDGVDTRHMTAATFTRLMAKRSQGERQMTLLKGLAPLTPRTPRTPKF